ARGKMLPGDGIESFNEREAPVGIGPSSTRVKSGVDARPGRRLTAIGLRPRWHAIGAGNAGQTEQAQSDYQGRKLHRYLQFAWGRRARLLRSEMPDDVGREDGQSVALAVVEGLGIERVVPGDLRPERHRRREPMLPADGIVEVRGLEPGALAVLVVKILN